MLFFHPMNLHRVSSAVFALILSLTVFPFFHSGAVQGSYFGEETPTPIYGSTLSEEDLEGKIVIIVFWGVDSPECRDGLAHMMQIQALTAGVEDLVILGSHIQETTPAAAELLEKVHCSFTVYDHFVPAECSLPEGDALTLPLVYMFDESGKLVASGTPKEISTQIPDTLRQKIEAGARKGFRYSPLAEIIVPEEFKTLETYFSPRRSWQQGFLYLEKIADDDENELASDAQVLRDQILTLIYDELERLETLSASRPGEAAYRLHLLRTNLWNTDLYEDLTEQLAELRTRRGVPEMISVYSRIENLRGMVKQRRRPFLTMNEAEQIRSWLYTLSRSRSYDEAVRAEASILFEIADKKMREF